MRETDNVHARATVTRAKIVAVARTWIGTPYRLTGHDRTGVDCCNFPAEVYRELGLLGKSLPSYHRVSEPELLALIAGLGFDRISPRAALSGDLLIFRAYAWNCHPGILTDRGVIHCPAAPVVEQRIAAVGGSVLTAYRALGII